MVVLCRVRQFEAKFDTLSGGKYMEWREGYHKADLRNPTRRKFCKGDNLPDGDISKSTSLIHFNIWSLPAHFKEIEVSGNTINNPSVTGFQSREHRAGRGNVILHSHF